MKNLENKNIIITGASGGIGNSIVQKLYDNGAKILASGTKIEKLEELKKKFKNIEILKFDISLAVTLDINLIFESSNFIFSICSSIILVALLIKLQ